MSKEPIKLRSELFLRRAEEKQRYCHHPKIIVVEEIRLLLCEKCELWIDPFDYLMKWALKDWAARRVAQDWENQAKEMAATVLELKKEERRIKGRIRTAKKRH